jgi:C4-dicarboxylate transporter/malic acid transport protein
MSTITHGRPAAEPAPALTQIVRGFHPGWFGAVMGTGIVATLAYLNPGGQSGLVRTAHVVGVTVAIITWLIAVAIAVPYLARMFRHPEASLQDLRHPIVGALYATLPAAIIVLAVTTATVGKSVSSADTVFAIVAVLAGLGALLSFAIGVIFVYILFCGEGAPIEAPNGGWFIPPVVSILIPLALAPLLPRVGSLTARVLLFTGYAAWGVGFFLFVLVAAVLFQRLVFHLLPPAQLAPSIWIGLGPIGAGSLALLKLAHAGVPVWGSDGAVVEKITSVAAAVLWGFGVWWFAIAALTLIRYLRRGGLPYGVGWWAFTFPLGAYTAATIDLARTWHLGLLEWTGVALFLLLIGFWLTVVVRTCQAMRTGEAWQR